MLKLPFARRSSAGSRDGNELIVQDFVDSSLQFAVHPSTGVIFLSRILDVTSHPKLREGDVVVGVDGKPTTLEALNRHAKSGKTKAEFSRPGSSSSSSSASSSAAAQRPKSKHTESDVAYEEHLPVAQEVLPLAGPPPPFAAKAPPLPKTMATTSTTGAILTTIQLGTKLDALHKSPLVPKIRELATDSSPEPNTGWRWRSGTVVEVLANNQFCVAFSEPREGYANDTIVSNSPLEIASWGSKSPDHLMQHQFKSDDVLDVLDYFPSKYDGRMLSKWRKCQIINVRPNYIRVTFCGWSTKFDLSLHVLEESHRLAEFGRYTERQQVEETQREVDFRKALRMRNGMQVIDVSPDGNCLFRAMSILLFGTQDQHGDIRTKVCEYLLSESARFELFLVAENDTGMEFTFADYVKNMRKPGEWGGEPELRILEEIYDRPIEMYSCDLVGNEGDRDFTKPVAHYNDEEEEQACKGREPLRLSFHGNNHYNAVVLINNGAVTPKFPAHPEVNEGKLKKLRKGSLPAPEMTRRLSFRAPSMVRTEPK
ncbi:hypothetical protein BASA81_012483 [Batrachochytrium salamandrivorans]|nr:hypothetical protein BASA81_012483 [Batrachochytrium salamandrivorans]